MRAGETLYFLWAGFPLKQLLLLQSTGSRVCGFQELQLPGSTAQAPQLWCMLSAVLWHVGSSQLRDRTHVSCIGRVILYHWATREIQESAFCFYNFSLLFSVFIDFCYSAWSLWIFLFLVLEMESKVYIDIFILGIQGVCICIYTHTHILDIISFLM